jgi:hypothetical protein
MVWEPFAIAVVFGLVISAGLYFIVMWPQVEPADDDDEPAPGDGEAAPLGDSAPAAPTEPAADDGAPPPAA